MAKKVRKLLPSKLNTVITFYFKDKSGVAPTEVVVLFKHIQENCSNLEVVGLMTIGAYNYDLSLGPNPDFLVSRTKHICFAIL